MINKETHLNFDKTKELWWLDAGWATRCPSNPLCQFSSTGLGKKTRWKAHGSRHGSYYSSSVTCFSKH